MLPVDWVEPTDSAYVLWVDTLIRVLVPSWVKSGDIQSSAGTGLFRVTNLLTGAFADSKDTLKIRFAALNDHTSVFGTPADKNVPLITRNLNSKGGVSIYYNSTFKADTNAVKAFERALVSWRCATLINYVVEDSSAISVLSNAGKISYKPLPTGTLTTLAATNNLPYVICGTLAEASLRRKFEISFNSSLSWHALVSMPTVLPSLTYDLESRAAHELGHAHLLNHSNNIEDLMYWTDSFPPYNYRRNIMPNDIAGGIHIVDKSTKPLPNPSVFCNDLMIRISLSDCMKTSELEELGLEESPSIKIKPNPVYDLLKLQFSPNSSLENISKVLIFDVTGRLRLAKDNDFETLIVENLEAGFYFLAIATSEGKYIVSQFVKQ
jgi:Secretion system C-terminal sorting domain